MPQRGIYLVTVLLVDDDPAVREVLRDLVPLCGEQFQVVGEAGDGLQAVEMAMALKPDVILMDVRMPRLDGIGATRRLKQELGCPSAIVMFSSFPWPELEAAAKEAGAVHHLCKPFEMEELKAVLAEAVGCED
ncbi:MAG: response regulator [Firmicutes bacterium]|jgi:CheY-like chemotaxis protein|nr:response regulator [Bacillota bacterium]